MIKKGKYWITNRIYYKNEKESDKLKMSGGAWSINLSTFVPQDIDKFIFITHRNTYEINRTDAFDYGFVRVFQGESKLIVPLKKWNIIHKEVKV